MAKKLSKSNIETTKVVEAWNVSQSIDAFSNQSAASGNGHKEAYAISVSGSFDVTGSITGQHLVTNSLTASYAITASYAKTTLSSSHALTASFITGSNVYGPFGSNSVISASHALSAVSASYADSVPAGVGGIWTASNGEVTSAQNVQITGSLSISGSIPIDN